MGLRKIKQALEKNQRNAFLSVGAIMQHFFNTFELRGSVLTVKAEYDNDELG